MEAINFTKTSIQALPCPTKGRTYYKDTKEKGLALYITATGVITFFIRKRVNGKDERIILGAFPQMSVEQARHKALTAKAQVSAGEDPAAEKKKLKADITFGAMFIQFMERYSKLFKKSWKYDEREVNKFLGHWFSKKASQISKLEVQRLHEQIFANNGLYQANRLLERIRVIYNKAIEWGWNGVNPTNGIKKFKEKSRERYLKPEELPRFFESLEEEQNQAIKDYIWLSILTGARKSNVLAMRWKDIDFTRREWVIPDTKNGESHGIPLVEKALAVLIARQDVCKGVYVFPSESSRHGYLQDPKKGWARILKRAGIEDLRIHDIRRTMGSYQAITGASLQIIGKSLGHKSQHATQVYSRLHNDPVRASMEKAVKEMTGYKNNK